MLPHIFHVLDGKYGSRVRLLLARITHGRGNICLLPESDPPLPLCSHWSLPLITYWKINFCISYLIGCVWFPNPEVLLTSASLHRKISLEEHTCGLFR
jgi:hypothetical protein